MPRILRPILALVLCASVTGCYGPFRLTDKVYDFNKSLGGKWVKEAAFLAMVIFPVYEFSLLIDAIGLNSVEFWTGKNPLSVKAVDQGETSTVLTYKRDAKRLRVDRFEKGRPVRTLILEPGEQGGMVAHEAGGAMLMSASTEGGQVVVRDASGRIVARQPS